MTALNQLEKVKAMMAEGWTVVPHVKSEMRPGAPILLTKDGKYIMVSASNETIEPTPEDILNW